MASAAVYIRVSTDEQAKKGYSLADQETDSRRKVADLLPGASVAIYRDDGISGSLLERPALDRLRDDLQAGIIDLVVTLDPDRLSRDLQHLLLLVDEIERKARNGLHFVSMTWERTPEGRLFLSLRGAVAEFEKAKIRDRLMRGRRQKVKQGQIGSPPIWLYGYRYDSTTKTVRIEETERPVVERIFATYTRTDAGVSAIAAQLQQEGVPSPRAPIDGQGRWHAATIHYMLGNPAYAGRLRQFSNRGRRPDAQEVSIPAIIAEDVLAAAVRKMKARHAANPGRAAAGHARWMLSGILWCGVCGQRMYVNQAMWGTRKYYYYHCRTMRRNAYGYHMERCGNTRYGRDELDSQVWNTVFQLLTRTSAEWKALLTEEHAKHVSGQKQLTEIAAKIERLRSARSRVTALLVKGSLTETEADEALQETRREIATLNDQHQRLSAIVTLDQGQMDRFVASMDGLRVEASDAEGLDARRRIVLAVLARVEVGPEKHLNYMLRWP